MQIYECRGTPAQWVFVAPEAKLFDAQGRSIGSHGAGLHWLADDGSRLVGSLEARADAPTAGAIPWLLLTTAANAAHGRFGGVSHIQRINTVGGMAPASGCDATTVGSRVRIPYTADSRDPRHGDRADRRSRGGGRGDAPTGFWRPVTAIRNGDADDNDATARDASWASNEGVHYRFSTDVGTAMGRQLGELAAARWLAQPH